MIELPFPPNNLSPNARCHWAVKAKSFKAYKFECSVLLRPYGKQLSGRDSFELCFCPPDRRRRDLDNMLSATKAALDALSGVCGVDDSRFKLRIVKGDPRKGGAVILA